jgi:anti-anti-sigma factor
MQDFQLLLSEPHARVLELRLAGEIDLATVAPLREATTTAIASRDYDRLIFDLSGVTFIDSSGLHVLAQAQRALGRDGGATLVICAAPNVRKVFELTGLDRLLQIVSDRAEALAPAA